jgi:hypothetical protein
MTYSPSSRLARTLWEALDVKKRELGQVAFKQTQLSDNHIQDIIRTASQKTGVPEAQILAKMQKYIDDIEDMKKYSYLLYDTAARNAAQGAAFDLIEHSHHEHREKFDPVTFLKLINMVQMEHRQFFPLRAPGETNYIFTINPILIPSNKSEYKKWNGVINTAAATPKGEFLFNVPFMQKLMDFAAVEGLKPQGKKYKSNGGPIPDEYAYIEFLIMHELLHYTYGDFAAGDRLKQYSHQVHNWASDFRSNYMLVKSGYDQLPIGLFSDHINYDRQGKYKEMVELVDSELKKLPKKLQDVFTDIADLDDHQPQPSGPQPPQPHQPPPPPQPPRPVQVGDVVKDKKSGGFWKVTAITSDGKIETRAATQAEVDAARTPQQGGA